MDMSSERKFIGYIDIKCCLWCFPIILDKTLNNVKDIGHFVAVLCSRKVQQNMASLSDHGHPIS